ncbi:MAG: alpha/beta hydrolase [Bacteroidetes bacterium]|nr:alpha/beta hydrolase [Bacteroidota bacterium]
MHLIHKYIFIICFSASVFAQNNESKIIYHRKNKAAHYCLNYLKHDTLISTSSATIHITYNQNPNKPDLLLLHGLGLNGLSTWKRQVKILSESYNLIIPDLIYFGKSKSFSQNYTVEFQAQQINEALTQLNFFKKMYVAGYSYGGLTAAMFNQIFHEKVEKLIIIAGPVKFYSSLLADSLAKSVGSPNIYHILVPENIKEFDAMRKAMLSKKMFIPRFIKRKIITEHFMKQKADRHKIIDALLNNEKKYQTLNYNLQNTKTLLIWGNRDGVVPLFTGNSIHNAFPLQTQLIILKNIKHDVLFRKSKMVNKYISAFLINT